MPLSFAHAIPIPEPFTLLSGFLSPTSPQSTPAPGHLSHVDSLYSVLYRKSCSFYGIIQNSAQLMGTWRLFQPYPCLHIQRQTLLLVGLDDHRDPFNSEHLASELKGGNESFSMWGTHVLDKDPQHSLCVSSLELHKHCIIGGGYCYFKAGSRLNVHLTCLGCGKLGVGNSIPGPADSHRLNLFERSLPS